MYKFNSVAQHICNPEIENADLMCSVVSVIYNMVSGFVFYYFRV